jgi:hydroxymethylpyrimidine pyrophosphatase-like HAD family hydrolase/energy-coupling factor transporter ATP-binding protein EcfA2
LNARDHLVNVHVLACDYDGTIADGGRCLPDVVQALARVRDSGRKVLLVTGRMLPDLRSVCPDVDRMFDAVVAENGALLYFPETREARALGDAPEPALVEELRRHGVPFDLGSSMIATTEAWADAALAAIRDTGVERTLVFNKGALMLLPGGVTKGTGLDAALTVLALSAHNMVGIGDAENDHAFLAMSECAVAVADAIPALRERADYVTRAPGARGVIEFIQEHLVNDLAAIMPRLTRHRLTIGETGDGEPVTIAPHGARLLIVGPSASGKSTLTGLLVERLIESGRSVLLIDPEGDYQAFAELERVVVFGGGSERVLPTPDELRQLLHQPRTSLVLNLSAMSRAEKVAYASKALGAVAIVRSTTGLPHWVILDEAHHIVPADGSPVGELLRAGTESFCMSTLDVSELAPDVRGLPNVVAATELAAFTAATRAAASGRPPSLAGQPLAQGEAAIAWLGPQPRAQRFRVGKRRVQHRRHVRKYTEGELPPDRSFYFRGPAGALNLRASNLVRFVELAEGVDEPTWAWHLGQQDYSSWARQQIKDDDLAGALAAVETAGLPAAESRRRALDEIRARYTV